MNPKTAELLEMLLNIDRYQAAGVLAAVAPGGGFLFAANHGDIPWRVPETVLQYITTALDQWGDYPLKWVA
ncbi:MAG TPA: hypothetical protein VN611_02080 [Patescibacteria group bacterium]|nr:hypothetical protein [Patescibacteria group bacterium]